MKKIISFVLLTILTITFTFTLKVDASEVSNNDAAFSYLTSTMDVKNILEDDLGGGEGTTDSTAPVITGGGVHYTSVDDPVTVAELEATLSATDETDGDISANFVLVTDNYTGNEGVLGEYLVTFSVSDAAGNSASVDFLVRVVDITAPWIQIQGDVTMYIEYGDSYVEANLQNTVHDNYDGDTEQGATITGTVDNNTLGTYYVYYNAVDSSGNEATEVIRSVIIQDTQIPQIEISDPTMYIEYGNSYVEANLQNTVYDNFDGTIQQGATITGTVDSSTLGTYYVYYNYTDTSGNQAVQVVRTVIVRDTTAATLTMNGSSTINIEYGNTYSEQGVTYLDSKDGTGSAVISGTVDSNTLGTYIITYSYTDSSGNVSSPLTRTVIVQDTTAATLTMNGSSTLNIEFGNTYSEQGVTYSDNHDGTGNATITGTVNNAALGTYVLTYSYTDSSGNVSSTLTRTVTIQDTTAPWIQIQGDTTTYIEYGENYIESNLQNTVHDIYDGDIEQGATITGTVNSSTLGTYYVYYNAVDSNGNIATEVVRTVIVRDTTAATLTMNGAAAISIEFGDSYSELNVSYFDEFDGTGNATITGTVNVGVLGVYDLYYNYTDSNGNVSATLHRVVTVQDTLAPEITSGNTIIIFNSDFKTLSDVMNGFVAYDIYDGDLSSSLVVTTDNYSPNENIVGIYNMTTEVSDSNGNDLVFGFTIEVKDDTPPVISASSYLLTVAVADAMTQAEIKAHILGW